MAAKKPETVAPQRQENASARLSAIKMAMDQIEKQYGRGSIMRLGERMKTEGQIEVIPTGSIALDLALGVGGLPKGRIIEIYGPEASGKTTISLHVVAEAQRRGGQCAFIDAEHALDSARAEAIGVNLDDMLLSQPDTGEQALEITETLIRSGAVDVIVVDSVAALVPRAELEGEMGDAVMGLQARLMSQALRKLTGAISKSKTILIFTNQLRQKIGVMFGNPETTPGGLALKFYSSVRIDIRKIESIKDGEMVIGSRHRARIVKNKVAPPLRVAEFDIMNSEGISKSGGLLDVGTELGIITKSGSFFNYNGKVLAQGREAAKMALKEEPKLADEVRVGWNAYSILKTSKDDLGNRFALYYNTFGDYRPTGIFYLTLPSLLIFGLSEFAVRYPSALIGALTVFPLYALTIQIRKNKRVALCAAIFLAFIPWHWMTSRATSEVVMSVFFALWGLVFFMKALKNNKNKHFVFSVILIFLSCLLYHSIRLLAPIFLITCLVFYWNNLSIETKKKAINTCIASILIVGALLLTKGSLGRFQQVSITKTLSAPTVLGTHTSKTTLVSRVTTEYAKYFSADFLIGDAAKPYRYRVFGVSTLGIPLLLLFICGVITIIQKKSSTLPLYLLILSPLPAAITMEDSPNLHRALFMLPFFLLIAADGYVHFIKRKGLKKVGVFLLITFFFFESTSAYLNYFRSGAYNAAPYRNVAAKDLILRVLGERNKYDHIVVTNDPDSPYPWFAFYGQLDPAEFNAYAIKRNEGPWNWQNVTFTQNKCPAGEVFEKDSPLKGNVLVIDAATCNKESIQKDIPTAKLVDEVTNPDGNTAYHMWEKPKL